MVRLFIRPRLIALKAADRTKRLSASNRGSGHNQSRRQPQTWVLSKQLFGRNNDSISSYHNRPLRRSPLASAMWVRSAILTAQCSVAMPCIYRTIVLGGITPKQNLALAA